MSAKRWGLGCVALVAVAARLPHTLHAALWQDEVSSSRILAERTPWGMLGRVARTESTPPLWYALGWLAHHAGLSIVDVRLLSVAFGALLAVAVVLLAREVVPGAAAYVAGLAVALGSQFVVHGRELRAYELLALAATGLGLALVRVLRSQTRPALVTLGAVTAAGMLTHYFFALSLAAAVAWLWLDPQARPVRVRASLAIGAGAALSAAWAPWFLRQYAHDRFWWIGTFRTSAVVEAPLGLFVAGPTSLAAGAAFLAAVVAGVVSLARVPQGRLFGALALGPLVAAASLWAAGERIFSLRNTIELGPFAAVAVVAAVSSLPVRVRASALAGLAAALVAAAVVAPPQSVAPYDRLARTLVAAGWRPGDPIAVFGDPLELRAPLEWYLPRRPALYIGGGSARRCRRMFLVLGPLRARRAHGLHGLHAGRWLVVPVVPGQVASRGARFLVTRRGACVRLSRDPRLAPIL